MEKSYQPLKFEQNIYEEWMKKKYFKAEVNKNKTPFTIIMPPPNITSKLHMGHAFQQTISDVIIRRKRMQGYEALWLPGTDHAAIATEVKVVEKLREEGKTKEGVGRVEFAKHIENWYTKYKGVIIEQYKRMGYSCDWNRLAFTMDEGNSNAVNYVFVSLYKKGYIYKGDRIVNWCPVCKTSISDAEVDFRESHSHLWHIRYKIKETGEYVTFATTRPETLLGDTAVAVHPKDKRYSHLLGKHAVVPFVNRLIPIIADEYVDKNFGTGVVKITPAHDANDFEVGERHNLESINIMNKDATINENGGKFVGLDRYEARKQILIELSDDLVKTEKYENSVGHCDRCGAVIEPLLSKQWFVKMSELAKPAIVAVENDSVHFMKERHKKIYLHWMKNIRDWCISRQLWSGHRIPIYTCADCGEVIVEYDKPKKCGCGSDKLVQELDTLDTWFSSALWAMSTLGFPNQTEDLKYFYPTNVMVTAQEIIQLWVARMIFMGLEFMQEIPFKQVLINGTVKDELGRKMSKSLGNGIDPIDLIDKYGVDTLRFSLLNGIAIDTDFRFSEKKVEINRNFLNKIWNASYFVLSKLKGEKIKQIDKVELSISDKWIISKLNNLVKSVNEKFDNYEIGMVASDLYDFFWNVFCDWYLEISKITIIKNKPATLTTLNYVLETLLKLLHPFIPFITEEIYLNLPSHDESIMISSFSQYNQNLNFESEEEQFEKVLTTIKMIRNTRAELKVAENVKTKLYVLPLVENINQYLKIIEKLSNSKELEIIKDEGDAKNCTVVVSELMKAFIKIEVDKVKERERLNEELNKIENEIARSNGLLNNEGFVSKAPQKLIDNENEKLKKFNLLKENILQEIERLI